MAAAAAAEVGAAPVPSYTVRGVTSVVVWKTADLAKYRNELTATVERVLGGKRLGRWQVEYVRYDKAKPAATRIQQRHSVRQKSRRTGTAGNAGPPYLQSITLPGEAPFYLARGKTLVQGDASLGTALVSGAGIATLRTKGAIEGLRFSVGDFTVSIGACKIKNTYRALVVEVAYGPCVSILAGAPIVSDFLFSLGRPDQQAIMPIITDGARSPLISGPTFTSAHLALQYLRVFETA